MEMIQSFIFSTMLDKKMDTLKRNCQFLESKKDDIEEEFKHEESSLMKKPRKEVEMWLMNVESVKHEVRKLEREVAESTLFVRLQLERSVDNLTKEMTGLVEQSKFPRGLTIEATENGVPFLTKRLVGQTFQQNKDMIWNCLIKEKKKNIIGVYGMGGAGKTTLLMHIHNRLLSHPDIEVAWVTVSQNFSIQGLQRAIAKTLHFDISKEDDEKIRAAKLAMALERKNNFVLILDDVWEHFNLDEVGIIVDADHVHKLILTTRSLTVCRMMNCQTQIKVEPLCPQEAWTLFVETLGYENYLSCQSKEIAESLVKECAGLPLGIIITARSMRGVYDIDEWRNALEEIRGAENWHNDMEFFEVFRVLKYSYDRLKDSKLQECLLYCSLFPQDALIEKDVLIEYLIMEMLIEGRKSRKAMFLKGHAMLKKLESVCLLEGQMYGHKKGYVKMHDLVRDMAIKIASEKSPFLVKAGMRLTNIPDEEEWSENLVRVSLMRNHISEIPSNASPKCPRILTLLLCDNYFLTVIPECFFMHMNSLTILDLSNTSMESLPVSISNLESLTALLLGNCTRLSSVPSLENLTAMRKLDLSGTSIKDVPDGMDKLVNLRELNLDRCPIVKIPEGIVPKLSLIQHFSAAAKLLRGEEIGSLRNLEAFRGRFHHVDELNTCFGSWRSRDPNNVYKIEVTHMDSLLHGIIDLTTGENQANLKDFDSNSRVEKSPLVFPIGMLLDGCHSIQNHCGVRSIDEAKDSRACDTNKCGVMRHMVCSCYFSNIPLAQGLEALKLVGSSKMDLLVREVTTSSPSSSLASVFPTNSFSSLKQVEISGCHNLKELFMPALLSNLQNLEKLEVKNCKQLVEIIREAEPDKDEDGKEATTRTIQSLAKLKSLRLYALQNLKSFCGSSIRVPDSLEEIAIMYCWELKTITLLCEGPYPHPSLRKIYVENDCWDLMEWKHPETKAVFQPYLDFTRPTFF